MAVKSFGMAASAPFTLLNSDSHRKAICQGESGRPGAQGLQDGAPRRLWLRHQEAGHALLHGGEPDPHWNYLELRVPELDLEARGMHALNLGLKLC